MNFALLLPTIMIAFAVAGVVFYVLNKAEDRSVVRQSLSSLDDYDVGTTEAGSRDEQLQGSVLERVIIPAMANANGFTKRFTPLGYADKIRAKYTHAGVTTPEAVDRFMALKAIVIPISVILFIVDTLVFNIIPLRGFKGIILTGLLCLGIALFPDIRLNRRIEDRQKLILRTLPDVCDLLTISVEAGLGFEQALDRVIDSVPGPLSDEFARMLGESRSGASRADSMRAMDERIDISEVRSFVLAIIQADMFGISIGRVLRAQSEEMRIKRRQLAQEQAQKAPVKMLIPMVFCIFPSLFVVILGPAGINIYTTL